MGSGRNCAPESWWAVMPEKTLFVFAGPNGSGKSTVIGKYMTSGYITADSYVCPDNIVKHIRLKFPNLDEYDAYLRAMQTAEKARKAFVQNGKAFSFETVFSNPDKLKFLRFAKAYGFHIIVIYITTDDPSINVRRVQRRVSEGGHDVPEEKIRARYERSMTLMPEVISFADESEVYDNSIDEQAPQLVFKKMPSGQMHGIIRQHQQWIQKYLISPLSDMGYVINMTCE